MRANAGIVISASHNPYYDNGIKIFSADGYKLPDEVELNLEDLVFSPNLNHHLPTGSSIGTTARIEDAIGQYAVFLKEQFPKHLTLEGIRIVLDCANGAAYRVAPKVFEELGAEVFLTGCQPDGTNINEGCGSLHPQKLTEKVRLYKADVGIAVDGDADRVAMVDEKGELLDGDEIMAICGIHYLRQNRLKANTLVATIMSNMGLDLALRRHNGRVIRTQVGDRYVVEEIRKGGYTLGGEQSGHLIFHDCATTGDGILAALSLLEILIEKGEGLHTLKSCIEKLPQVLKSIKVPDKIPIAELPELSRAIDKIEQHLGTEGRVLFRYSGTEKKARIMIEGNDEEKISGLLEELAEKTIHSIDKHHLPKSDD